MNAKHHESFKLAVEYDDIKHFFASFQWVGTDGLTPKKLSLTILYSKVNAILKLFKTTSWAALAFPLDNFNLIG